MTLGKTKKKRRKKGLLTATESRTYVLLLLVVAALGYLTYLGATATRSADDFWYSTFFKSSPEGFFALTQKHYETFNGRAIIHMVAQLLLYFGNSSFALLMLLLMGAAPLLAEEGERTWGQRLGGMLVFFVGMAILPLEMARQSLTWISAFCNYVLPPVLILLQIRLLFLFSERGGAALGLLCCLQSLICGATTEQSGVVAFCVALFSVFYAFFQKKLRALFCFLCTLCAFGGVATIFASPATQERAAMETEVIETVWEKLFMGLEAQSEYFFAYGTVQIFLFLLPAAIAALLFQRWHKKAAWLSLGTALLYAAALVVGYQTPDSAPWAYLACLVLTALWALILWLEKHRRYSALLLCGLASLFVILPTQSNAPRTMFPFVFYLLLVLGGLAAELISIQEKVWWAYPLLFGVTLYVVVPQVPIYWKNHQVETLNLAYVEAARETGVLYHCMDYNTEYSHTKAHVDGYTYGQFLMAEGLSLDETKVYVYSEDLPVVYVNGRRASSPALKGEGGNWLLPMRDIVEGLGGTVETGSTIRVFLADTECYLEPYGPMARCLNARYFTEERKGPWKRGVAEQAVDHFCTCISLRFYTEYMGLEVEFRPDEGPGAFYVTLPGMEPEEEEKTNGMADGSHSAYVFLH